MNVHTKVKDGRPHGAVGPNAVTRLAEALASMKGDAVRRDVFARAGLEYHLASPPTRMIDQRDVAALHRALNERLGAENAALVSREAGRLTGDYLLANRIPRFAQILLRLTPRPIAARVLTRAIARHAWTFAGAGDFSHAFTPGLTLRLRGSPLCLSLRSAEPACAYYAATFERVFRAMLGPGVRVVEIACEATGADACVFSVTW